MFSFFKKKPPPSEAAAAAPSVPADAGSQSPESTASAPPEQTTSWRERLGRWTGFGSGEAAPVDVPLQPPSVTPAPSVASAPPPAAPPAPSIAPPPSQPITLTGQADRRVERPPPAAAPSADGDRSDWLARLRGGLRKTGSGIAQVFTGGARIDGALYDDLEAALLQADAGMKATAYLLDDLRKRVKRAGAADAATAKTLLADALAELLAPLEQPLQIGEETPTVMMVVGVNGAGKTTTIGKLTRHLVDADQKVMLAAADTFRAAAREQLNVWAGRADEPSRGGRVDIVSQEGGDPAGVTFDAVVAGKARECDVVIADTAGRLTTQAHLMEELKKVKRVIGKAQDGAPHEVLLVIDGNTGQNALAQVQAFDAALDLTGLVVTKLDGTAKGGVLAAIALWARDRGTRLAVYFIGVGEKLEDLQTFRAREFAQALLG
jgi:fused signal recognition particle receptor